MIPLAIFFALMAGLAVLDAYKKTIPNLIVLPATFIAAVCLSTGPAVGVAFLIGLFIYKKNKCGGGDIKLFLMVAAFLGWAGLLVLPITILLIKFYRKIRDNYAPLAVAPFAAISSFVIVTTEYLLRQFCR